MDVPRMLYVDISSLIKDVENKNVSYRKRIVRRYFYHKTFGQGYYYYYDKSTDYNDASQSCRGTLHIRAECVVVPEKYSYGLD